MIGQDMHDGLWVGDSMTPLLLRAGDLQIGIAICQPSPNSCGGQPARLVLLNTGVRKDASHDQTRLEWARLSGEESRSTGRPSELWPFGSALLKFVGSPVANVHGTLSRPFFNSRYNPPSHFPRILMVQGVLGIVCVRTSKYVSRLCAWRESSWLSCPWPICQRNP